MPVESTLERELNWLDRVLQARLSLHFGQPCEVEDVRQITPPPPLGESAYDRLLRAPEWGFDERLLLVLALTPHVRPQLLDTLFLRNANLERGYTEFGGWTGRMHRGFLPTCETGAFLLAGDNLTRRLDVCRLFEASHWLHTRGILRVEHDAPGEPSLSAALLLHDEFRDLLTTDQQHKPDFSRSFPARLTTTQLTWDDLVLGHEAMDQISAITTWLRHAQTLLQDWRLATVVQPGYRALFYGPPGTGKAFAAALIGQAANADVYRVDLSMVVSKFIGETEANLSRVFDQAEQRQWILFFDEAEALFGKRTATNSEHDHFAAHQVSYLQQRMADFPGTVIFSANLNSTIDDGFARRFQSLVYFPMPDAAQRRRLWEGMARHTGRFAAEVDVPGLATQYELSGGAIVNVVRAAAISAIQAGRSDISTADLRHAIAREMGKHG